jgi:hypothetical protein
LLHQAAAPAFHDTHIGGYGSLLSQGCRLTTIDVNPFRFASQDPR